MTFEQGLKKAFATTQPETHPAREAGSLRDPFYAERPACKCPKWCGVELMKLPADPRGAIYLADVISARDTVVRGSFRYCSSTCAPAVPARACKAPTWCGHDINDTPRHKAWIDDPGSCGAPRSQDNRRRYCSESCVPPLSAQGTAQFNECSCPHGPHTTDGRCSIHVTAGIESRGFVTCSCGPCRDGRSPTPQAKPVETAKPVTCCRIGAEMALDWPNVGRRPCPFHAGKVVLVKPAPLSLLGDWDLLPDAEGY